MSSFSTVHITRSKAREIFFNDGYNLSDEELERYLDDRFRDRLYNFSIVGDDNEENEDLFVDCVLL